MSVAPIVYVAPDARRNRILAVGTAPPESALRVEVFRPGPPPSGVSKFDCLAAVFHHGLKAIIYRSFLRTRPEVLVRGAEILAPTFGGYERDLVARALEQGGARRVRWPEEFDGHAG